MATTKLGGRFRTAPAVAVAFKTAWDAGSWTAAADILCDQRTYACAPTISTARLQARYGVGLNSAGTYSNVDAVDIRGFFVRLVASGGEQHEADAPDTPWYGVILDDQRNEDGAIPGAAPEDDPQPSGIHLMTAYGLEELLHRTVLRTSFIDRGEQPEIGRALPFNRVSDSQDMMLGGNKAPSENRFGDASVANVYWTALDIVRYLLKEHAPGAGEQMEWELRGDYDWLAGSTPTIEAEGRSIYELLSMLIAPQRGATWYVQADEPDGDGKQIIGVYVASFAKEDIALGGDLPTLSKNGNQFDLDTNDDPAVLQCAKIRAGVNYYKRVIVYGRRIGVTCTLSTEYETLIADWSAADETRYKAGNVGGNNGQGPFPSDAVDRARRADDMRLSDAYSRVYTHFTLPPHWDGRTVWSGGPGRPAVPVVGTKSLAAIRASNDLDSFFGPGLRFSRVLPLQAQTDYTFGNIYTNPPNSLTGLPEIPTTLPEGRTPDLRAPFAVIKLPESYYDEELTGQIDRYQYVDKLHEHDEFPMACDLQMQQNAPGIIVRPASPAHVIAGEDFDPDGDTMSDVEPVYDWRTLRATVHLLIDRHVSAEWPPQDSESPPWGAEIGALTTLEIDAGDDFAFEWVVPRTIVDVRDGVLMETEGGCLRDDRVRLRSIARMAYEWYLQDRIAATIQVRSISTLHPLGHMINDLDGEAANCVVTSIQHDFVSGATTLTTALAELDFVAVAR